jgi:hypothetical protein
MGDRPPVPADVAQTLRAEAFFGCCRCGKPIIQYHHIVPYEQGQHFRVPDMMVLCVECHDMATKGVLKESKQRQFNANPHNKKHGYVKGLLYVDEPAGAALLSETSLVGSGCFVSVGEECLVRLGVGPDGGLELSVALYNKEDEPILTIERNEWIAGDLKLWDLISDYQVLRLRSKPYKVLLDINAKKSPLTVRGRFWSSGTLIDCKPSRMVVNTPAIENMIVQGGRMAGARFVVSKDGKMIGIR